MSVDPLASERTWVFPYNYVQNNPINRVDPTGTLDNDQIDVIANDDGTYTVVDGELNDGFPAYGEDLGSAIGIIKVLQRSIMYSFKIVTMVLVLFSFVSCDPFSNTDKLELLIGNEKIYILSKSWGIGTSHYRVFISRNKTIDESDLNMGEFFNVFYSIEQNKLVIHTYEEFQVPTNLKDFVKIEYYDDGIKYIKLNNQLDENDIEGLKLYQPFEIKRE